MDITDKWSGLATLLADLIEKHVDELHIDELPDPHVNISITNDREETRPNKKT